MPDGHHVESFDARHYPATTEVWCPDVDEVVIVLESRYLRCCPMCGGALDG